MRLLSFRPFAAAAILGIGAISISMAANAAPGCDPKKTYTGRISDLSFGFETSDLESKYDTVELDTYKGLEFICKRCNNGPFTALAKQGNVRGVMTKSTVGDRFNIQVACPAADDGSFLIRTATRAK